MTEENLKNLSLEDLYNRMVKAILELKLINDSSDDPDTYQKKREEIKQIHSLIEIKKKKPDNSSINHSS